MQAKKQPTVDIFKMCINKCLIWLIFRAIINKKDRRGRMFDISLLGENIRNFRRLCGLTQSALAEKLYLTAQNVSKWETGKSLPDAALMLELCEILGITVNDLLRDKHQED